MNKTKTKVAVFLSIFIGLGFGSSNSFAENVYMDCRINTKEISGEGYSSSTLRNYKMETGIFGEEYYTKRKGKWRKLCSLDSEREYVSGNFKRERLDKALRCVSKDYRTKDTSDGSSNAGVYNGDVLYDFELKKIDGKGVGKFEIGEGLKGRSFEYTFSNCKVVER